MKIKDNFVLQTIADEYIVVPVAEEAMRINGVIKLNATGAFLWELLSQKDCDEKELVEKTIAQYHIRPEDTERDVKAFLKTLCEFGCFEHI